MIERDKVLTIRITEEERNMLQALSEATGLSQSDYVRQFVRRAYADRFAQHGPESPLKTSKRGGAESVRRWVAEAKSKKR